MRLIPRRIRDLLSRAQQARDAQRLAQRSGVRTINADTDEAFDREVERIMREEPGNYLFVPRQQTEDEWLAKHGQPVTGEENHPAASGPTE